jgi:PAS domain S-box-containing protein
LFHTNDLESIYKEFKQQQEQFEIISEKMTEALFIFDKEGKYILVNKAARERYGKALEKVGESRGFVEYFDFEGNKIPFQEMPSYQALHGNAVAEKVVLMKSYLGDKYLSISSSPIFDEKGNLIYGVVISREVTAMVKYEQTIKKQQNEILKKEIEKREALEDSIKLKDEFLYLITHEFKTPIAVISLALQAIDVMFKHQLPDKANQFLYSIKQNTNRQLRLVNNLLDITRFSAGRINIYESSFDIVFVTKSIINSIQVYSQQKNLKVRFSSKFNKKIVLLDEEKYERILLNLLSNAIKFTPKGKSINVTLSTKRYKNKGMVCISVQDEGIGIPKDKQDYIFERFGQVDTSLSRYAEGTGIGLYLVKLLINALGGFITLESEDGNGSTFTVLLPLKKALTINGDNTLNENDVQSMHNDNRLLEKITIELSDIF